MRPRLSGTQAGTLVTDMRDAWSDPKAADPMVLGIMEAAEIDAETSTPTAHILERIDAWLASGRGWEKIPVPDDVMTTPCITEMIECVSTMGVSPHALVRLAVHNDGIARVDDPDADRRESIIVLDLRGFGSTVEVRLTDEIIWMGDELRMKNVDMPDTLQTGMIGREAVDIVDHPSMRGLLVVDSRRVDGETRLTLAVDPPQTLGEALGGVD